MSTVTTFVSSHTAAKAVDEKTLSIKCTCGLFISMSFVDSATMRSVALEILKNVDGPTYNNTMGGSDTDSRSFAGKFDALRIDEDSKDDAADADTAASSGADETHSSGAGAESSEVESSFESYCDGGLPQEVHF